MDSKSFKTWHEEAFWFSHVEKWERNKVDCFFSPRLDLFFVSECYHHWISILLHPCKPELKKKGRRRNCWRHTDRPEEKNVPILLSHSCHAQTECYFGATTRIQATYTCAVRILHFSFFWQKVAAGQKRLSYRLHRLHRQTGAATWSETYRHHYITLMIINDLK